jgi:RNA polymerase sigma-70 factor (ECF subfamily)
MLRIAQHDADAYRTLVGRYLNLCVRYAERMLGNRSSAEDVAQEVWLKIWERTPQCLPQAKFSTWLYRVLMNACIDYTRRTKSFVVLAETNSPPDIAPEADSLMISSQRAARVRRGLGNLPERQRVAVILSYYEGVTNQEAAEAMELEVGAFQQLLFRARQNLKEELKDDLKDEPKETTSGSRTR